MVSTDSRADRVGAGALRLLGGGLGGGDDGGRRGVLGLLAGGLERVPELAHLVVDLLLGLALRPVEVLLEVVGPSQQDRAPLADEQLGDAPRAEVVDVLLELLAEGDLELVGDLAGDDQLRVADALVGVGDRGHVAQVGPEERELDHQVPRLAVEHAGLAEELAPPRVDEPLERADRDPLRVPDLDPERRGLREESGQLDGAGDALRRLEHRVVLVVGGAEGGDHHDRRPVLRGVRAELRLDLGLHGVEVPEEVALRRDPAGLDRVRVADVAGIDDREAEGDGGAGGLHGVAVSFSRC